MRYKKQAKSASTLTLSLLAAALIGLSGASSAANISDVVASKNAQTKINGTDLKSSQVDSEDKDAPEWLRDSERLNAMLGNNADSRIENAKAIRKVETPISGLDGFVVQADVFSTASPEGRKEYFVFYTDKTRRYLVVGMMIDMEKDRDLNQLVERSIRGEVADNPALALRPQDMHGILIKGGKSKSPPLQFVVDLGPQAGRGALISLIRMHQQLVASGANPRPLNIILVSAGKDEISTAAMAMAMGFDKINGDGMVKLIEFCEKGAKASWLDRKVLAKDAKLKQALGIGAFKIDDNSTQALLARLDTLPLVYDNLGEQFKYAPLPTNQNEWRALLMR